MLIARKLTAFARVGIAGDFNDALRARVNITLELSFLPLYIKHGINVWTFRPAIYHSETIVVTNASIKIEWRRIFPRRGMQFSLFFLPLFPRRTTTHHRSRDVAFSFSPATEYTHARVSAFAGSCRATRLVVMKYNGVSRSRIYRIAAVTEATPRVYV